MLTEYDRFIYEGKNFFVSEWKKYSSTKSVANNSRFHWKWQEKL